MQQAKNMIAEDTRDREEEDEMQIHMLMHWGKPPEAWKSMIEEVDEGLKLTARGYGVPADLLRLRYIGSSTAEKFLPVLKSGNNEENDGGGDWKRELQEIKITVKGKQREIKCSPPVVPWGQNRYYGNECGPPDGMSKRGAYRGFRHEDEDCAPGASGDQRYPRPREDKPDDRGGACGEYWRTGPPEGMRNSARAYRMEKWIPGMQQEMGEVASGQYWEEYEATAGFQMNESAYPNCDLDCAIRGTRLDHVVHKLPVKMHGDVLNCSIEDALCDRLDPGEMAEKPKEPEKQKPKTYARRYRRKLRVTMLPSKDPRTYEIMHVESAEKIYLARVGKSRAKEEYLLDRKVMEAVPWVQQKDLVCGRPYGVYHNQDWKRARLERLFGNVATVLLVDEGRPCAFRVPESGFCQRLKPLPIEFTRISIRAIQVELGDKVKEVIRQNWGDRPLQDLLKVGTLFLMRLSLSKEEEEVDPTESIVSETGDSGTFEPEDKDPKSVVEHIALVSPRMSLEKFCGHLQSGQEHFRKEERQSQMGDEDEGNSSAPDPRPRIRRVSGTMTEAELMKQICAMSIDPPSLPGNTTF